MRRRLELTAILMFGPLACGGLYGADDDPIQLPPRADDGGDEGNGGGTGDAASGLDVSSSDGGADASADACKPTPSSCLAPAQTCVNNCRVTYNICCAACPQDASLMSCLATCKSQVGVCQQPCKGDCTVCGNAMGSCTTSGDCSVILYVP